MSIVTEGTAKKRAGSSARCPGVARRTIPGGERTCGGAIPGPRTGVGPAGSRGRHNGLFPLCYPNEPAEATELFDAFLAGCIEKAEEIDDSGGDLGRFAKDLVCGWVRARQATGADPDETARLILSRYDDDPYAFLYDAETDLAKALDHPGIAAFERIVRSRWEETSATPDRRTPGRELAWRNVLKAIYEAQRDAKRYAEVCERTGTAPGDCERLARIAFARGKPGEALAWTERGLAIEKGSRLGTAAGVALSELRRRLLVKLGRPEDARAAAWRESWIARERSAIAT